MSGWVISLTSFITCLGNAILPSATIRSKYLKAFHWLLMETIDFASIRAEESITQMETSSRFK